MSKNFTPRPALSQRGRGRGRTQDSANEPAVVGESISPHAAASTRGATGRGASGGRGVGAGASSFGRGVGGRGPRPEPGLPGAAGGKTTTSSTSSLQERATYAGGFTVIRPDEKRRREVAEQAERETRQYEQYRQQNKPTSFSYVGTAGAGEGVSLAEARQKQIHSQAQHSKASRLVREQDRRSQQRQEENTALAERGQAARKQTTMNMQRQKDKPEHWKAEMNSVNQAFLDRLETQSKVKGTSDEQT